jgi:hypothetical protein
MKKLSLVMLFMLTTLFSFSQNWKELRTENGIKIEYSIQENSNNTIEYIVFKLTNTELIDKDVDVKLTFDYGHGMKPDDNTTNIILIPNTPIVGDVSTRYLVISKRFLNNMTKTILIDFNIQIQTN